MRLIVFTPLLAFVTVSMSIPMPSRNEGLPDGIVPFARYADEVEGQYRLPKNTLPLHYHIELTTDVHKGEAGQEFTGYVRIRIRAIELSTVITMHQRQLTIERVALYSTAASPVLIQDNIIPTYNDDLEFLNIQPTTPLVANVEYFVDITYRGLLRDDNMGFYRSSYKNSSGKTVWLATTQFEQTDARHAFPCYDEPQIRTPFVIEIKHDKSYKAISNMPLINEPTDVPQSNYVISKFQETPKVQTYLIAFVISDFTYIENNDEKKQRVFAKKQSIDNGEAVLALDAGKKLLDAFQTHLGVPYDLPKMDQIAIPDFDAGAMENWGLVTYREEYLLYNQELSTTRQRENILTIISHEYAHQWFGNHVSPKWWSYLWLNEGFATLYEDYLASLVYPEDRLMDLFVVDTVQTVLETDANPSIRPMTYYVESPEKISDLFDRVAYSKSGSVLRMMQVALGVTTWTKGLKNYLEAKKYEAATPDDLYDGLQKALDIDVPGNNLSVSAIMKTWETQAGYPVVYVSRNPRNQLTFEQKRFYYSDATSLTRWIVPVNFVVGSNPNFTEAKPDFWMPADRAWKLDVENSTKPWTLDDWVILNIQESGYYRVNYDGNLWNLLIQQLHGNDFKNIHLLNRAQLVDDSLNLARGGHIRYEIPLDILKYLGKELDYPPWAAANRGLTLLNRWLSGSSVYANYQKFVQEIVEPLYNKLGVEVIENEPKLDRYARSMAINLACEAGLTSCLTQTAAKLQEVIANGASIAPDLQSAIYCNGLRQANAQAFSFLQGKMIASEDQAERSLIINALGCSQSAALLTQYLNLAIQPGGSFRLQEIFRVLVSPVSNGELGLQVMIDFISGNSQEILAISPTQVNTMLSNIASRISSQAIFTDFDTLLKKMESLSVINEGSAASFRATANLNLEWQVTNLIQFESWFAKGEETTAPPVTTAAPTDPTANPTTMATTSTTLGAGSVMISTFVLTICALIKFML